LQHSQIRTFIDWFFTIVRYGGPGISFFVVHRKPISTLLGLHMLWVSTTIDNYTRNL